MQPMIPHHLRAVADVIACRGSAMTLQLVCPCGCERFTVWENTDTPEQAALRAKFEAASGFPRDTMTVWAKTAKDGSQRWYRRRLGHILPERFEPAFCPPELTLQRVAVQCAKCGAETVVFDNRMHGYDGAVCGTELSPDFVPLMKQKFAKSSPARRIRVRVTCDADEAEFADLDGAGAEAMLSECFTSVEILSETAPGKYRSFFAAETA